MKVNVNTVLLTACSHKSGQTATMVGLDAIRWQRSQSNSAVLLEMSPQQDLWADNAISASGLYASSPQ